MAMFDEEETTQDTPVTPVTPLPYDSEMYKGYNMIILNRGEQYPFQFGLAKAKLILANLDKIKAFVEHEELLKKNAPKKSYQRSFKKGGA